MSLPSHDLTEDQLDADTGEHRQLQEGEDRGAHGQSQNAAGRGWNTALEKKKASVQCCANSPRKSPIPGLVSVVFSTVWLS